MYHFYKILFLLPSAILLVPARVNGDCSYSSCASNLYPKDEILYPFRTPDQPNTCGLPGFDLGCNSSIQTPLLSFPSGQSFSVESISYDSKVLRIRDPQRCLPKKLLRNVDTLGTPFRFTSFTNFTLYSCPSEARLRLFFGYYSPCNIVDCGQASSYSVVCVSKNSSLLKSGCELVGDVRVPGTWTYPAQFTFSDEAYVRWGMPSFCLSCAGKCERNRKDYSRITCNHIVTLKSVIAAILGVVAILVVAAAITCTLCKCRITIRRIRNSGATNPTAATNRQSTIASGVIGQDTINTYPIMVVGESGRMLTNMEDKVCSICLEEYASKDTLKLLPVCLHKFHAGCIDEWLRAKPTCPICRTPPPLMS